MLKHIPLSCYDEETYTSIKNFYTPFFERTYKRVKDISSCIRTTIYYQFEEDEFVEERMDKLVVLISAMLWAIENGGIPDDDPADVAYNVWDVLKDFSTGNYDDLFTPEDLILVKQDVKTLYDYFDKHPLLKGD